ncbi:MAG: diguanylate cyclase [Methylococcales bacterium]|nr:diguanylate cyclase [Methylococcales bacterium]
MPKEIHDNLHLILDAITDGVVMVDSLGKVLYANQSAERIFEREYLIGKTLGIPINPSATIPQEINLVRPSGIGWAELRSAPIVWHGTQAYVIGVRDITESKITDTRLRQAATIFENTRDGVMVVNTQLRITHINTAFTDITGYTEAEAIGQRASLLRSGRHNAEFFREMWQSIVMTGHWQGEIWNRRKNGEVYPELLSISAVTDKSGEVSNYVGVFADISKIKASEVHLDFLAHHDPLTRLPNRLLLLSRLEHALKIAQREQKMFALLMLDLDRFKEVNDSFGHLAGDELLQQIAQRLSSRLRGVDTVCRLGGDEFTILLEDMSQPEDAALVANDIINVLSEPWQLSENIEVRIGASVGISLYPDHGDEPEQLLQQADSALYHAKSQGRGCFKYFSVAITQAARLRMDIEVRLRRGINQGELRVFYQPQVDINTGRIVGAEALVRWQDPLNG